MSLIVAKIDDNLIAALMMGKAPKGGRKKVLETARLELLGEVITANSEAGERAYLLRALAAVVGFGCGGTCGDSYHQFCDCGFEHSTSQGLDFNDYFEK